MEEEGWPDWQLCEINRRAEKGKEEKRIANKREGVCVVRKEWQRAQITSERGIAGEADSQGKSGEQSSCMGMIY